MNIVFLVGFQILIAAGPLLCCWRSKRKSCTGKTIVPLPLTPLEKHKNEYKQSLHKWDQPKPALTYRVPGINCTLCGRRDIDETDHSIIHGQAAPDKSHPWQVFIRGAKSTCGGVLIAPQWVLTAAHCINATVFTLMGTTNRVNYSSHAVVRYPEKEIIHEKYREERSDIALIKLNRSVVYNSYIRPICLPRNVIKFSEVTECYATGWGRTGLSQNTNAKLLQEIKVQIMSHSDCYSEYKGVHAAFTTAHVCTKLNKALPNSGPCFGDSGGPLSCRVGNRFYLAGIAIRVQAECKKTSVPDLFVRVSYYRHWIMRTILANGGT